MKISDSFEGENSSLRKAFNEAVSAEKTVDEVVDGILDILYIVKNEANKSRVRPFIQAERTKRDEMVGLLKIARCPDSSCDNEGTAVNGYGEPYQCRWCYERDGITQTNNQN